jgi:hypothetical protein
MKVTHDKECEAARTVHDLCMKCKGPGMVPVGDVVTTCKAAVRQVREHSKRIWIGSGEDMPPQVVTN